MKGQDINSQIIKSKKAMKAIQWEKIPNHIISGTIWSEIFKSAYKDLQVNREELEFLFGKNEKARKITNGQDIAITKEPIKEIIRFLDRKQSQNFGNSNLFF
jgi:hypothetical protein